MKYNLIFIILLISTSLSGQILKKDSYHLIQTDEEDSEYFLGNGIVDILIKDSLVWAGTGSGINKSSDGGRTWSTYDSHDYLCKGGISALGFMDDSTLWIAAAYDTFITSDGNQHLPAGGGLSYTRDFGVTWNRISQPKDAKNIEEYKPTTTHVQNLTYDIAFLDSTIWIASFGGGLRKSSNMGNNWEVVTTDYFPFSSLEYLNHRAFSLVSENGNIWVGTAEGISKSSDGGNIWRRFTHQNQSFPIPGNFVVALAYQPYTGSVWAACKGIREYDITETDGVCKTDNGGETWEVVLDSIFAHNFAFYESKVYVAADEGLFVSDDGGETWYTLPNIRDYQTGEELINPQYYSAGISVENGNPRLWVGTSDGLAATNDNGNHWKVIRSYQATRKENVANTYAYPSPFSPFRNEGYIRFQYDITQSTEVIIDIYDFAMDKVTTIREYETGPAGNSPDRSAKWDGRNKYGHVVADGIYYFRVNIDGEINWGKFVVIK
jgi:ligand-binding sensor domain-containing protein